MRVSLFSIFHLSFVINHNNPLTRMTTELKMTNDKWKMENGK